MINPVATQNLQKRPTRRQTRKPRLTEAVADASGETTVLTHYNHDYTPRRSSKGKYQSTNGRVSYVQDKLIGESGSFAPRIFVTAPHMPHIEGNKIAVQPSTSKPKQSASEKANATNKCIRLTREMIEDKISYESDAATYKYSLSLRRRSTIDRWWPNIDWSRSTYFSEANDPFLCTNDMIIKHQHGDLKLSPTSTVQTIRYQLIDYLSQSRNDNNIYFEPNYFAREYHLTRGAISFRLQKTTDCTFLDHPPIFRAAYFPKSCRSKKDRRDYLRERYLESLQYHLKLRPSAIRKKIPNFKKSSFKESELYDWHMAGRHIHGFFTIMEPIETEMFEDRKKRYLVDIFNWFMFPFFVDYDRWDIKIKIAFDMVTTYNLHLAEILRRNFDQINEVGEDLLKPYSPFSQRMKYKKTHMELAVIDNLMDRHLEMDRKAHIRTENMKMFQKVSVIGGVKKDIEVIGLYKSSELPHELEQCDMTEYQRVAVYEDPSMVEQYVDNGQTAIIEQYSEYPEEFQYTLNGNVVELHDGTHQEMYYEDCNQEYPPEEYIWYDEDGVPLMPQPEMGPAIEYIHENGEVFLDCNPVNEIVIENSGEIMFDEKVLLSDEMPFEGSDVYQTYNEQFDDMSRICDTVYDENGQEVLIDLGQNGGIVEEQLQQLEQNSRPINSLQSGQEPHVKENVVLNDDVIVRYPTVVDVTRLECAHLFTHRISLTRSRSLEHLDKLSTSVLKRATSEDSLFIDPSLLENIDDCLDLKESESYMNWQMRKNSKVSRHVSRRELIDAHRLNSLRHYEVWSEASEEQMIRRMQLPCLDELSTMMAGQCGNHELDDFNGVVHCIREMICTVSAMEDVQLAEAAIDPMESFCDDLKRRRSRNCSLNMTAANKILFSIDFMENGNFMGEIQPQQLIDLNLDDDLNLMELSLDDEKMNGQESIRIEEVEKDDTAQIIEEILMSTNLDQEQPIQASTSHLKSISLVSAWENKNNSENVEAIKNLRMYDVRSLMSTRDKLILEEIGSHTGINFDDLPRYINDMTLMKRRKPVCKRDAKTFFENIALCFVYYFNNDASKGQWKFEMDIDTVLGGKMEHIKEEICKRLNLKRENEQEVVETTTEAILCHEDETVGVVAVFESSQVEEDRVAITSCKSNLKRKEAIEPQIDVVMDLSVIERQKAEVIDCSSTWSAEEFEQKEESASIFITENERASLKCLTSNVGRNKKNENSESVIIIKSPNVARSAMVTSEQGLRRNEEMEDSTMVVNCSYLEKTEMAVNDEEIDVNRKNEDATEICLKMKNKETSSMEMTWLNVLRTKKPLNDVSMNASATIRESLLETIEMSSTVKCFEKARKCDEMEASTIVTERLFESTKFSATHSNIVLNAKLENCEAVSVCKIGRNASDMLKVTTIASEFIKPAMVEEQIALVKLANHAEACLSVSQCNSMIARAEEVMSTEKNVCLRNEAATSFSCVTMEQDFEHKQQDMKADLVFGISERFVFEMTVSVNNAHRSRKNQESSVLVVGMQQVFEQTCLNVIEKRKQLRNVGNAHKKCGALMKIQEKESNNGSFTQCTWDKEDSEEMVQVGVVGTIEEKEFASLAVTKRSVQRNVGNEQVNSVLLMKQSEFDTAVCNVITAPKVEKTRTVVGESLTVVRTIPIDRYSCQVQATEVRMNKGTIAGCSFQVNEKIKMGVTMNQMNAVMGFKRKRQSANAQITFNAAVKNNATVEWTSSECSLASAEVTLNALCTLPVKPVKVCDDFEAERTVRPIGINYLNRELPTTYKDLVSKQSFRKISQKYKYACVYKWENTEMVVPYKNDSISRLLPGIEFEIYEHLYRVNADRKYRRLETLVKITNCKCQGNPVRISKDMREMFNSLPIAPRIFVQINNRCDLNRVFGYFFCNHSRSRMLATYNMPKLKTHYLSSVNFVDDKSIFEFKADKVLNMVSGSQAAGDFPLIMPDHSMPLNKDWCLEYLHKEGGHVSFPLLEADQRLLMGDDDIDSILMDNPSSKSFDIDTLPNDNVLTQSNHQNNQYERISNEIHAMPQYHEQYHSNAEQMQYHSSQFDQPRKDISPMVANNNSYLMQSQKHEPPALPTFANKNQTHISPIQQQHQQPQSTSMAPFPNQMEANTNQELFSRQTMNSQNQPTMSPFPGPSHSHPEMSSYKQQIPQYQMQQTMYMHPQQQQQQVMPSHFGAQHQEAYHHMSSFPSQQQQHVHHQQPIQNVYHQQQVSSFPAQPVQQQYQQTMQQGTSYPGMSQFPGHLQSYPGRPEDTMRANSRMLENYPNLSSALMSTATPKAKRGRKRKEPEMVSPEMLTPVKPAPKAKRGRPSKKAMAEAARAAKVKAEAEAAEYASQAYERAEYPGRYDYYNYGKTVVQQRDSTQFGYNYQYHQNYQVQDMQMQQQQQYSSHMYQQPNSFPNSYMSPQNTIYPNRQQPQQQQPQPQPPQTTPQQQYASTPQKQQMSYPVTPQQQHSQYPSTPQSAIVENSPFKSGYFTAPMTPSNGISPQNMMASNYCSPAMEYNRSASTVPPQDPSMQYQHDNWMGHEQRACSAIPSMNEPVYHEQNIQLPAAASQSTSYQEADKDYYNQNGGSAYYSHENSNQYYETSQSQIGYDSIQPQKNEHEKQHHDLLFPNEEPAQYPSDNGAMMNNQTEPVEHELTKTDDNVGNVENEQHSIKDTDSVDAFVDSVDPMSLVGGCIDLSGFCNNSADLVDALSPVVSQPNQDVWLDQPKDNWQAEDTLSKTAGNDKDFMEKVGDYGFELEVSSTTDVCNAENVDVPTAEMTMPYEEPIQNNSNEDIIIENANNLESVPVAEPDELQIIPSEEIEYVENIEVSGEESNSVSVQEIVENVQRQAVDVNQHLGQCSIPDDILERKDENTTDENGALPKDGVMVLKEFFPQLICMNDQSNTSARASTSTSPTNEVWNKSSPLQVKESLVAEHTVAISQEPMDQEIEPSQSRDSEPYNNVSDLFDKFSSPKKDTSNSTQRNRKTRRRSSNEEHVPSKKSKTNDMMVSDSPKAAKKLPTFGERIGVLRDHFRNESKEIAECISRSRPMKRLYRRVTRAKSSDDGEVVSYSNMYQGNRMRNLSQCRLKDIEKHSRKKIRQVQRNVGRTLENHNGLMLTMDDSNYEQDLANPYRLFDSNDDYSDATKFEMIKALFGYPKMKTYRGTRADHAERHEEMLRTSYDASLHQYQGEKVDIPYKPRLETLSSVPVLQRYWYLVQFVDEQLRKASDVLKILENKQCGEHDKVLVQAYKQVMAVNAALFERYLHKVVQCIFNVLSVYAAEFSRSTKWLDEMIETKKNEIVIMRRQMFSLDQFNRMLEDLNEILKNPGASKCRAAANALVRLLIERVRIPNFLMNELVEIAWADSIPKHEFSMELSSIDMKKSFKDSVLVSMFMEKAKKKFFPVGMLQEYVNSYGQNHLAPLNSLLFAMYLQAQHKIRAIQKAIGRRSIDRVMANFYDYQYFTRFLDIIYTRGYTLGKNDVRSNAELTNAFVLSAMSSVRPLQFDLLYEVDLLNEFYKKLMSSGNEFELHVPPTTYSVGMREENGVLTVNMLVEKLLPIRVDSRMGKPKRRIFLYPPTGPSFYVNENQNNMAKFTLDDKTRMVYGQMYQRKDVAWTDAFPVSILPRSFAIEKWRDYLEQKNKINVLKFCALTHSRDREHLKRVLKRSSDMYSNCFECHQKAKSELESMTNNGINYTIVHEVLKKSLTFAQPSDFLHEYPANPQQAIHRSNSQMNCISVGKHLLTKEL